MTTANRHDRNIQREFERTKAVASTTAQKNEVPTETISRPKRVKKSA